MKPHSNAIRALGGAKLVQTDDGTFTARSGYFDECYHSTRDGALKESLKKHVEPAFSLTPFKPKLNILDICFGLGYNTLSTLYFLDQKAWRGEVAIYAPEFDEALVRSLPDFPYPEALTPYREVIETVASGKPYEANAKRVEVVLGDARDFLRQTDLTFDIVYQDAFSPKKNPLLWTQEYFAELTARLSPDAIITTYSSATPVRMGMVANGLFVYEPPEDEVRSGTIASLRDDLPLKLIDMALKKARNPAAAAMYDREYL